MDNETEDELGRIIRDVITSEFIPNNKKNIEGAKFKIGEEVMFVPLRPQTPAPNMKAKILAMSNTGGGVEYAIDVHDFLVWEEELKPMMALVVDNT